MFTCPKIEPPQHHRSLQNQYPLLLRPTPLAISVTMTLSKQRPIRCKKLLAAARGASCVNCGARDGTIVAAHYQGLRSAHYGKGKSQKPHDILVADLCHKCHAAFDNYEVGEGVGFLKKIDASEQFQHLILKTLIRRINEGVITL